MKIFLDANILFSASNTASALYQLLQRLHQHHTLASSHYAIDEARRNLTIKRPDWLEVFEQWLIFHISDPNVPSPYSALSCTDIFCIIQC